MEVGEVLVLVYFYQNLIIKILIFILIILTAIVIELILLIVFCHPDLIKVCLSIYERLKFVCLGGENSWHWAKLRFFWKF